MSDLLGKVFKAASADKPEVLSMEGCREINLTELHSGGLSPIHEAARCGSTKFLSAAKDHESFDPWARDASQRLPIDHALAYGHNDAYEMLDDLMYPPGWWSQP